MVETKLEVIQKRALEIAKQEVERHVRGLGDERLEKLADAIISTSAVISARLLVEYDENKEKGNI